MSKKRKAEDGTVAEMTEPSPKKVLICTYINIVFVIFPIYLLVQGTVLDL